MIGESDGLNSRYVGLLRKVEGRSARAAWIAACTSRAAPLISRLKPNWMTICADPTERVDVSCETSAIAPRRRSSGSATVDAMMSGLAPAMFACTTITGKAMFGNGATGSRKYASAPAIRIAIARSVVATGRRMNNAEMFTALAPPTRQVHQVHQGGQVRRCDA